VQVAIKLYADSAHVTRLPGSPVTVEAGKQATVRVSFGDPRITIGDGFFPLGIVVVPEADRTWTREVPLPPAGTPLVQ
jgi:hypothetical protein